MSAENLFLTAWKAGVEMTVDGDAIRLKASSKPPEESLQGALRSSKLVPIRILNDGCHGQALRLPVPKLSVTRASEALAHGTPS